MNSVNSVKSLNALGPSLPQQKAASSFTGLYTLLRAFAVLFLIILGTLLFGMMGSLVYPGGGAILGSIVGLLLCSALACCVIGTWRDILQSGSNTFGAEQLLPRSLAVQLGHGYFDLIVTVDETRHVEVQGRMPWSSPEIYMEVACGANPVKRTSVKSDGKFNEQFKLKVAPADEMLVVRLKDQDVFGPRNIGYVCVDIQRDIVDAGFPTRAGFLVQAGEDDKLRRVDKQAVVILSFGLSGDDPGWGSTNKYGAVEYA